jgi:diaminopimelate decarboxylase
MWTFLGMAANRDQTILTYLVQNGVGMMCASEAEMRRAEKLGCPTDRILASNPNQSQHQLNFARATGIPMCVFDAWTELDNIRTHHPDADLLLRIEVEGGSAAAARFGAEKSEWKPLIQRCIQLGLDLVGVTCVSLGPITLSDSRVLTDGAGETDSTSITTLLRAISKQRSGTPRLYSILRNNLASR